MGAFDPSNSLNDQDAINLASWGFNHVRLGQFNIYAHPKRLPHSPGVMWPGVQPKPTGYDAEYLAYMGKLIDMVGDPRTLCVRPCLVINCFATKFNLFPPVAPWPARGA